MSEAQASIVNVPLPRREQYREAHQRIHDAQGTATLSFSYSTSEQPTPPTPVSRVRMPFLMLDGVGCKELRIGPNSIGRMPDNHIVLHSPLTSRKHCVVLVHSDGRCEVHDTASRNGTRVNGEVITGSKSLQGGDILQIGTQQMMLLYSEGNDDQDKTHFLSRPV